jgi:type II secretory pathway component GspD/PulD (secretin)
MNLRNGVDIQQVIQFLADQAGKPVLKDNDVQGRIVVTAPKKVTREEAVQLIYDVLEMQGVAVIESPRSIKLIKAEKAKSMRIQLLQPEESASSITNKAQIVQKVFKLKTTTPKSIEVALKPLLTAPDRIAIDERTKTVVITETAANVERFEQLIGALDSFEEGQMEMKIFKLEHANADELADIVASMAVAGEGGLMQVQGSRRDMGGGDYGGRFGGRRGGGGRVAGDLVVLPDMRTNWLIVAGPPDKMRRISEIIKELDVAGRTEVQIYVIDLKHADAYDLSEDIRDMLRTKMAREKQEVLELRSSSAGNQLIVMATPETYKLIKQMVEQLDTIEASERETRTYELKFMDAYDMAEQLQQLYEGQLGRGGYSIFGYGGYGGYGGGYGGSRGSRSGNQPQFVPSPRTNSIMVLAKPTEYEFIEKMIKELDVEVPEENLTPRVFHIVHTDAAEMVRVLTELFSGSATRRVGMEDTYMWRPRGSSSGQNQIGALYGKVRFVVYTNTNSIVVITNNANNFSAVTSLIKQLDILDPEATNMLVVQLKYADAAELSNNINNLLSDGPVARQGGTARPPQTQQQRAQGGTGTEPTTLQQNETPIEVIYPWQSAQRRQLRPGEEERPISSLIGHIRLVPDIRSQKLIVAAPSIYFDSIRMLIEDLDRPEPQVQLETFIVRVETTDESRIGWRWTPDANSIDPSELENAFSALTDMGMIDTFGGSRAFQQSGVTTTNNSGNQTQTGNQVVLNPWGSVTGTGSNSRSSFVFPQEIQPGRGVFSSQLNLTLLLQMLVKNRNARVVAHPQVTVNNNEQGQIFVGEDAPFESQAQSSQEGISVRTSVEYRPVGTELLITPQINKQGRVILRITLENSRRKPELVGGRIVTERQTYNTKLTVEDGQTVWLGGLTEQRLDNIVRKVPIFGQIPIAGYLFRKTDKVNLESVLYTFVTPVVLTTPEDAADQYQKARARIDTYEKEFKGIGEDLPGPVTPFKQREEAPSTRFPRDRSTSNTVHILQPNLDDEESSFSVTYVSEGKDGTKIVVGPPEGQVTVPPPSPRVLVTTNVPPINDADEPEAASRKEEAGSRRREGGSRRR